MTFAEKAHILMEYVYRLPHYNDGEWDAYKECAFAEVPNIIQLLAMFIEEQTIAGKDFDKLCVEERAKRYAKLDDETLNPPTVYL